MTQTDDPAPDVDPEPDVNPDDPDGDLPQGADGEPVDPEAE